MGRIGDGIKIRAKFWLQRGTLKVAMSFLLVGGLQAVASVSLLPFKQAVDMESMVYDGTNTISFSSETQGFSDLRFYLPKEGLSGMRSLNLEGRFLSGVDPFLVRLEVSGGTLSARCQTRFNAVNSRIEDRWIRSSIPLDELLQGQSVTAMQDAVVRLSFRGSGVFVFDRLEFDSDTVDMVPTELKILDSAELLDSRDDPEEIPSGHAVWVYRFNPELVEKIKTFNKKSPVPVRHLYVSAGAIAPKGIRLETNNLTQWREALPDAIIHAMLNGHTYDRKDETPSDSAYQQQNDLERNLAAYDFARQLKQVPWLSGVHIDAEPHITPLNKYFAVIREYLDIPLGAALGNARSSQMNREKDEVGAIAVLDNAVLMMYGPVRKEQRLIHFRRQSERILRKFRDACDESETPYWVGVAFDHFNEGRWSAREYTDVAFEVVEELCKEDKLFRGIAIWGVHFSEEGDGTWESLLEYTKENR